MPTISIAAILAFTISLAPTPQDPQRDRDLQEVQNYRLSMEVMRKLGAVNRALAAEAESDPKMQRLKKLEAEMEALSRKDELTDAESERMDALQAELEELEEESDDLPGEDANQSLDEMTRSIERVPALAAAVRKGGMSPREFVVAQMALFQAMLVHGFSQGGPIKELPKGVSKENVEFLRQHEAEIKEMTAEWKTYND